MSCDWNGDPEDVKFEFWRMLLTCILMVSWHSRTTVLELELRLSDSHQPALYSRF